MKINIEVVKGPEGHALYINDYRLVGPKPWGGGRVVHKWTTTLQALAQDLITAGILLPPSPDPETKGPGPT